MLDKTLKVRIKAVWISWLRVNNFLVDVHWIVIHEWSVTGMHLINQDTEGPPVNWLGVAFVEEDFGGDVLGCATDGVGALLDLFGKSIVNKFEIAIICNHDVLWLQVTIHDVLAVQILKH